ncbi:hypothetical protein DH2020_021771 [Rehmannia glutinosa]|uniref:Sister chromatid cohesion 1 protein 4 n=1 Tax=Rehmannia glutinosa TaxID=99300 RepID=A0ABR0WBF9_REHGL
MNANVTGCYAYLRCIVIDPSAVRKVQTVYFRIHTGPLGTIWIAAHLERKLRKNQVADTDIGVSVDSILSPDVPIALRLSSHLLLGVVRIYSRKVNYLFDDCSEALLKVKQAFRSAAVDLPPEESRAPYHSITLPETFDLDDFELPDNDIFQGNFVDHHISSREQITLQDTIAGVAYSTSKFGLDERFGDGDTSGLDLDEELFVDKIGTAGHANERWKGKEKYMHFLVFNATLTAFLSGWHQDKVDGVDDYADPMDYAQAPCTPGLVEEPNLSNVQEVSDHLETECPLVESTMTENANNNNYGDKQEVNWCSHDNANSDAIAMVSTEEYGYRSDGLDINFSKPLGESPVEANVEHDSVDEFLSGSKPSSDLVGQVKALNPDSELADKMDESSDVHCMEDLENGAANKDKNSSLLVDKPNDVHQGPYEIVLEKSACEISGLTSISHLVSEGVSAKDQGSLGVEVPSSVEIASNGEKSCTDASDLASKNQDGPFPQNPETQACHEPTDSRSLNLDVREKVSSAETLFLRPCNSNAEQLDITSGCVMSTDADVKSDVAALATSGREETVMPVKPTLLRHLLEKSYHLKKYGFFEHFAVGLLSIYLQLGKVCCVTDNSEEILKENHVQEHASLEDIHAASSEPNTQVHNANSHDKLVENVYNSAEAELLAPEKLLKKRSFTESTLTEQSLNSVESSRLVRFKRTVESVPDDDDLLSSILVGRSSVLKVKPTPRLSEATSIKRTRSAPRTGASKRKVLMDDTMVLHGDLSMLFLRLTLSLHLDSTIRQQLTNTEDIRRVRKKAPCTLLEISMIRKQYLEDEIFLEPIFTGPLYARCSDNVKSLILEVMCKLLTEEMVVELCGPVHLGMSLELVPLHSQMCDLSGITVCKNDLNGASLEIMTELRLPSENDENVVPLETMAEPMLASHEVKNDQSLPTEAEPQITSQNAENGESLDLENDKGSERFNVTEQSGERITSELLLDRDGEVAKSSESPLNNNMTKEVDELNEEINISIEQTKPTGDVEGDLSQQELSLDVTGVQAETIDTNTSVNADTSAVLPDEKMNAPLVELDSAVMNVDNEQAIIRDEHTVKDSDINAEVEPESRDDDLSQVAGDGATVELLLNDKHGEMEHTGHSEIHSVISGEHIVATPYPAEVCLQEDGFMNNGEPEQPEDYEHYMRNAEISGFDLHDREELNYSAAGNDTDYFQYRAVSKYLQTLFNKEAECGRKSLSMDNLLIGKSRKEASRMFFEALVLKTRDYIHVEQRNPFDDITIKPRSRLMKSDF